MPSHTSTPSKVKVTLLAPLSQLKAKKKNPKASALLPPLSEEDVRQKMVQFAQLLWPKQQREINEFRANEINVECAEAVGKILEVVREFDESDAQTEFLRKELCRKAGECSCALDDNVLAERTRHEWDCPMWKPQHECYCEGEYCGFGCPNNAD